MSTWGDIINDAFYELNAYPISEPIPAEDQALAIRTLNRILDWMAARRAYCYATQFALYTLTPGHAPTLIGPGLSSPDFATPNAIARPVRIVSAAIVLNTQTPSVDQPIRVRDAAWWANQRVKSLASNIPTDLFYRASFPSGELNFWPNPNYAYQTRLELWVPLGQFPVDANNNPNVKATFSAPEGYERALVKMLAGELSVPYGKALSPVLAAAIREARAAITGPNLKSPRIQSADYGTTNGGGGSFNWMTGMPS